MNKPFVLITGCGYKPVAHTYKFDGKPTHNEIVIDGKKCKMNIGTAAAVALSTADEDED